MKLYRQSESTALFRLRQPTIRHLIPCSLVLDSLQAALLRLFNFRILHIYFPRSGCGYGTNPVSASLSNAAQSGNINVLATAGCAWTATSDQAWLTIPSGGGNGAGTGNGTVTYNVTANTGPARTGNITIGDDITSQVFTVTQAAAPPPPILCTYGRCERSALQWHEQSDMERLERSCNNRCLDYLTRRHMRKSKSCRWFLHHSSTDDCRSENLYPDRQQCLRQQQLFNYILCRLRRSTQFIIIREAGVTLGLPDQLVGE